MGAYDICDLLAVQPHVVSRRAERFRLFDVREYAAGPGEGTSSPERDRFGCSVSLGMGGEQNHQRRLDPMRPGFLPEEPAQVDPSFKSFHEQGLDGRFQSHAKLSVFVRKTHLAYCCDAIKAGM